jgi:hypothetical protein
MLWFLFNALLAPGCQAVVGDYALKESPGDRAGRGGSDLGSPSDTNTAPDSGTSDGGPTDTESETGSAETVETTP